MNRSRITVGCLALLTLAVCASWQPLPAQDFSKVVPRPKTDVEGLVTDFREGNKPIRESSKAVTDANLAAINAMAEWLVYRLTNPDSITDTIPPPPAPTRVVNLVEDSRRYFWFPWTGQTSVFPTYAGGLSPSWRAPTDAQKAYVTEFGAAILKHLKVVVKHPKPIVRVNAGRFMTLLAQTGYDGMAEWLIEIIEGANEPLELKIYAFEAFKYMLAVRNPKRPNTTVIFDLARQKKVVEALSKAIVEVPDFQAPAAGSPQAATNAGKDLIDRMRVFAFKRRKATEALASMPQSVIRDDLDRVAARPAYTLMMVAVNDRRLAPEAPFRERVEALIGVCNMVPDERMNMDYATFGVAILLQEFVQERSQGRNSLPWKMTAARIKEAMNQWRNLANAKNVDKKELVVELDKIATEIMTPIMDKGLEAQVNADRLNRWIGDHRPMVDTLFGDEPKLALYPRIFGN
ncbi:hypothetical protein [Tuwongella immobilis]|uniref:HEAT repeat domain-containing protein n=1 Tax=Tuwongella immobilis TaxID=692036 RepID=A0A6C2YJK7_9BACT|nr:hypothetical protein [Tuwongella immobilis]VIP01419.1 unnamed protein product [Tuwongella immobilis]VTR98349.1 unnamed protein product [Tuwongella immobilis]